MGAALTAVLTLGGGILASSGSALVPQNERSSGVQTESEPAGVREKINPDGSCELVDANGVPLYDSQYEQRTGSSPCDEA